MPHPLATTFATVRDLLRYGVSRFSVTARAMPTTKPRT